MEHEFGLHSIRPKTNTLHFDIMLNGRHYRSMKLNLCVGEEYSVHDLKGFARLKYPSLEGKDFTVLPTTEPVLKK